MPQLAKGARVRVPQGTGTVAHIWRKPPDFREVESYLVWLDRRAYAANYKGTRVAAIDVWPVPQFDDLHPGAQRILRFLARQPASSKPASVSDICSRTNHEPTEVLEHFEPLLSRGYIQVFWARDEEQSRAAITLRGKEAANYE